MIDTHANYDVVLMKSLVNKIGYYQIAGDFGKSTHCIMKLFATMWKIPSHAPFADKVVNPNLWLIQSLTFVLALWAAL